MYPFIFSKEIAASASAASIYIPSGKRIVSVMLKPFSQRFPSLISSWYSCRVNLRSSFITKLVVVPVVPIDTLSAVFLWCHFGSASHFNEAFALFSPSTVKLALISSLLLLTPSGNFTLIFINWVDPFSVNPSTLIFWLPSASVLKVYVIPFATYMLFTKSGNFAFVFPRLISTSEVTIWSLLLAIPMDANKYPSLPDFILAIDALPLSPFSLKDKATLVITFGFEARVIVVVTPPTIEKLSCVKPIEVISPSAFVFTYSVTTSACPSLSKWTTFLFTMSPSTVLSWICLKLISTFTFPFSGSILLPSAVRKYTS